ncbi:hypothetical protein JCM10207_005563 [Rhodosporidiobolus poonsookiae]
MGRRGSFSDDEADVALQAADDLLADDESQRRASMSTTASHTGMAYSAHEGAPPRALAAAYGAAILLSTLSTRQLDRFVRHSRTTSLAFPLAHFGALEAAVVVLGYLQGRGMLSWATKGTGGQRIEAVPRRTAWLAGAVTALGLVLRLWELRVGDHRLGEALETFILPTLLAFLPYASTKLQSTPFTPSSSPFLIASAVSTFLVAFALVGIPASAGALALALVRLPLEAWSLILLREGISQEGLTGSFVKSSVISAFLISLVTLPISLLLLPQEPARNLNASGYVSLWTVLLFSVAAQLAIFAALLFFSSSSTAASTLFPRNFALLTLSTFDRQGLALSENWMQLALVYGFGSVAIAWTDDEVSSAVRNLRTGGAGSTYLPLNGHGSSPVLGHPSLPPNLRKSSSHDLSTEFSASARPSLLSLVPFFPLLLYLLTVPATTSSLSAACSYLPPTVRATVCPASSVGPTSRTVDLVVSYYDEAFERTRNHLNDIRKTDFVASRNSRVVLYNKGPRTETDIRAGLGLRWTDEVIPLPNLGREGATYLKHILLHYNSTLAALSPLFQPTAAPSLAPTLAHLRTTTLADHTYFLQPHLAWENIAAPRLQLVAPDTGFAHFGPLLRSDCGHDMRVDLPLAPLKELYNIFSGEICPPTGQLAAWSAQFAVSKRRILANPYARYASISALLEAPEGHWIHKMWGPNESGGPSNPAFGHAVERAWPVIFACSDPKLADQCPDEVAEKEKCQCLDS